MAYALAKLEVATYNGLGGDASTRKYIHYLAFYLNLGVKVTLNATQLPLHHVTDAAAKFEVAMSNGLGGDAFTKKYMI